MTEGADGLERLVQALVDAARRAVDRGLWSDARSLAEQVLREVPGHPDAQQILSTVDAESPLSALHGRRFLTVLFSDLVGSTPLSERLDLEDYLKIIAAYRDVVREAVGANGGHLDQFQGDGAVVYFGFPAAGEDDQVRAVQTGLEIVEGTRQLSDRFELELAARVGIHVGRTVMTGAHLGARDQSAAIGFAANVAARVQSMAAPGSVTVSKVAAEMLASDFRLEPMGTSRLRGITEEVELYRVDPARTRSAIGNDLVAVPLIGRVHLLDQIEAGWRRAAARREASPTVLLEGDPGIGKSRLARQAIALARLDDATVIEVGCFRSLRTVGLGAVRRSIEAALELDAKPEPDDDVHRAARERLGAVNVSPESVALIEWLLEPSSPGGPTADLTPDRRREALLDALLEWVRAEAASQNTILVVDDVHWADDTTIEALRRLTSRALPEGLFVMITTRSGLLPAPLSHLANNLHKVEPLGHDDVAELVRAVARPHELDDHDVEVLVERAEGVPLYVEHLTLAKLAAADSGQGDKLPATLERLLEVRIDSAGPGRPAAEVAAVIGRNFTAETLERTLDNLGRHTPLDAAKLPSALRALQRTGIIEETDSGLRFRHSLLREAAYDLQLHSALPARHAAVAAALTQLLDEKAPPETLSFHHEQAGDHAAAARFALEAAQQAADLVEWENALDHLERAKANISALRNDAASSTLADRLELAACMQLGSVSAASFSYARDDAERAYRRALELCDRLGATGSFTDALDVQLITALGGLWSKEVVAGDLPAARAITERVERIADLAPDELQPDLQCYVDGCRGFELMYSGDNDAAIAALESSSCADVGPVPISAGVPHDHFAASHGLLGVALTLAGHDQRAADAIERGLERAAILPFPMGPFTEALVEVYAAYRHRLRGDAEQAHRAAARVTEIGSVNGFQEHALLGQVLDLAASMIEGEPSACVALENVLAMWRSTGGGLAVPLLLTELAQGSLLCGDTERAEHALDEAWSMLATTDQRACEPEIMRLRARLALERGASPEVVLDDLVEAGRLGLRQGAVRLAARSVSDALSMSDGAPGRAVSALAESVRERIPAEASGDLLEVERTLSAV